MAQKTEPANQQHVLVDEPVGAIDIFGRSKISIDTNQTEIPYEDLNWANFVDQTASGGAPAASQADGQVTVSSGTGANGTRIVISKDAVKYRLGQEIGWGGTFRFDATGIANADVFWGALDDTSLTNAVVFGYFNGTWGVRYRRGASTIWTKIPSQWLDPCDGSVGSEYTLNGAPVAMSVAGNQIARIRAGLFGHRGFIVELCAPDGHWVKIIDHSNINSEIVAVFTNNDLKVGMGVVKTGADATNISVISACQAGWTASDKARLSDTLNDRTLASRIIAALVGRTNAGAWVGVAVNTNGRLFVTNDSVGPTGSAVPTDATFVAGTDGTNLRAFRLDSNGRTARDNAFATLLHYLPTGIGDEMRRDETLTDDYHGRAADGTATSVASWEVVRFYKTAGLITRVRYRSGVAWDSRTSGWS